MKKNIAFDIDGTLFYTSSNFIDGAFEITLNNKKRYVKIRPYINFLFDYLEENKDFFEIIIYSAATKDYVNILLNFIKKKSLISEIYDREFCDIVFVNEQPTYIKNYKKISKDLHNLYLIDDDKNHFDNFDVIGYKCKKYIGEDIDEEIFHIIDFLETVKII
jgi:TFIIF-interacting CTD phosphatase-like protein